MCQRQWLPGARSSRNRNRLSRSTTTRQLSGVQKRRASSSGSVGVFVENSLRLQCASTTSICSRPGCCCGIKDSFRNGKRSNCTVITARTGCEKTAQASSDRKNVGNGRKGGTGCEDWKRGMPGITHPQCNVIVVCSCVAPQTSSGKLGSPINRV